MNTTNQNNRDTYTAEYIRAAKLKYHLATQGGQDERITPTAYMEAYAEYSRQYDENGPHGCSND